jgi:putative endonuclease
MTNKGERVLASRRAAERRGRKSETLAAMFLMAKGYRILARRLRHPSGEIDMIALVPFGPVCFIEVKARQVERDAAESVGTQQWARIARVAQSWLAKRPNLAKRGARYDVVTVGKGRFPKHYRDAWRPDFHS